MCNSDFWFAQNAAIKSVAWTVY